MTQNGGRIRAGANLSRTKQCEIAPKPDIRESDTVNGPEPAQIAQNGGKWGKIEFAEAKWAI